jgi:acetyl-CoA acetyltransferase
MGIGPAPAIRALLERTGLTLAQIDRIEINEAFGAQVLACVRELGLDEAKLNVNGGAIAIGHPLGATGVRLTLTLAQIDRIEINEAFGAQVLACSRELGLDEAKLNVNGGAIAIGHPLGATGVRLTLTLARELRRSGLRYGIASACVGGGQGIAMLIENGAAN